jgi:hypothetical protein
MASSNPGFWVRNAALAVLVYVVSYGVNSLLGGYADRQYAYHGMFDTPASQIEWQPRWGSLQFAPESLLTRVYRPLMEVDRVWWHRPIDLDDVGWDKLTRLRAKGKLVSVRSDN